MIDSCHAIPPHPDRHPRILHVTECFLGGTRSAILSYAGDIPEMDHGLLGTLGRSRGDLNAPDEKFLEVQALPDGHLARIRAIRSLVVAWQPDIIHAHSSFAGVYVRLAIRNSPRHRVVYTPHAYGFERLDIGPVKRAAIHAAEALLTRNTEVIAACSTREQKLAHDMHARRTVFVPNVAAAQFHTHDAVRSLPEHRVVTVMGRIVPQRDPEFICRVADELARSDRETTIQWIGDGDPDGVAALRRHGIKVTGWLDAADIMVRLEKSSAYLHPGRWEGFPVAILEAHAMGLPIIARDAAYLYDAPSGVRGSNPSEIAKALVSLVADESARRSNYALWSAHLNHNTSEAQRAALLEVYTPQGTPSSPDNHRRAS